MKQYIVDAFTDQPFAGNPAAVCVMDHWPAEEMMMKLAMENNLSETAFLVKEAAGYHLRWFTPGTEVELCGHATLASAFVVLNFYDKESQEVRFHTLSGELIVRRKGNLYEMNFPTYELKEIPVTDEMETAYGIRPTKAILGLDLICVFEQEDQVRGMQPDQELLVGLPGRIQNATAAADAPAVAGTFAASESSTVAGTSVAGDGRVDCVSRSFCPKLSIAEDPVCGSAHCQIADYWSQALGKKEIYAYQASKRGGYLHCNLLENQRIALLGQACLVAVAEIMADLG